MSTRYRQLETVARDWMNEIWVKRDLNRFDEFHHPDFQDMSPAGRGSDRQSYRQGIEEIFKIFPDFLAIIEDLVVDETKSKVAIRWSANATQHGDFFGLKASRRGIYFQGIEIIAIDEHGQILERWGEWDGLSILEQITRENEG
jgi:predicted ester cyclase